MRCQVHINQSRLCQVDFLDLCLNPSFFAQRPDLWFYSPLKNLRENFLSLSFMHKIIFSNSFLRVWKIYFLESNPWLLLFVSLRFFRLFHLIQKAIKDECRMFFCSHLRFYGVDECEAHNENGNFGTLFWHETGDSLSRACCDVCWRSWEDNCYVFLKDGMHYWRKVEGWRKLFRKCLDEASRVRGVMRVQNQYISCKCSQ